MNKKVLYFNKAVKEKKINFNNLAKFDHNEIGLVLSCNPLILMKHWIKFQQEWIHNIYNQFKDHDKYLILMFLISKTWEKSSNLFKYYSIDEYYLQNEINLPNISLSVISTNLQIPKETIRRKLIELEEQNIIKREGQKIILVELALPILPKTLNHQKLFSI